MLRVLSVRDYVIAERVELEPGPGYTVLTGETGAGKSILVDALELLVGGRADSALVPITRSRALRTSSSSTATTPGRSDRSARRGSPTAT